MNNEKTIHKINVVGKIAEIFTIIAKVGLIIGLVAMIAGAIFLKSVPSDFVELKTASKVGVSVDKDAVSKVFGKFTLNKLEKSMTAKGYKFEMNDVEYSKTDVEVTDEKILVDAETSVVTKDAGDFTIMVVVFAIVILNALILVHMIGKLAKAVKTCDSPFAETVITSMRRLAISLIPYCIIQSICAGVLEMIGNGVNKVLDINIDGTSIMPILLVFFLTYVFSYGAELQKQSDETL